MAWQGWSGLSKDPGEWEKSSGGDCGWLASSGWGMQRHLKMHHLWLFPVALDPPLLFPALGPLGERLDAQVRVRVHDDLDERVGGEEWWGEAACGGGDGVDDGRRR